MASLSPIISQRLDELTLSTLKGLKARAPGPGWELLPLNEQLDELYRGHEFLKSVFKAVTINAFELCAELVEQSLGCSTCEENVKKIRALVAALKEGDAHGSEKGDFKG